MQFDPLVPGLNRFLGGMSPQIRQQGWERLRWGMSLDEALTNYPQARPDPDDERRLIMQASDPAPNHYRISLDFSSPGRQLESVSLTFAGSHETADFSALSQELTRRLGAPVSQTQTSSTWQRDTTKITLSRDPGGGIVLSELV